MAGGSLIEIRPASDFADVATLVGPKTAGSEACWCLTYRNRKTEGLERTGLSKPERMAALCARDLPPGIVVYDDGEPVAWASIAPREHTTFAYNAKFPRIDPGRDDVWSLWCIKVRPGHRGQGLAGAALEGAVGFAAERGAAVVEAYPLDNDGRKVPLRTAYTGTRRQFERAGFHYVADTTSVLDGFGRVVMRREI
ncbi:MAG TPA: GNAT family N-acetyltransferase [Gordonia sp. (in: high G+C Gram-positive bacteria)]|uniref:GNAT family N-acetyltransferase n=1 Tax=unclassified Gordonia (in: high G+C Gram-positive bacteria) TaxID=2657482 RepID=UPI000F90E801|nr:MULTISPECIES: GNAT family N-acetyltransferase [unclassified Gordonia (in: high G+C Gram-positive bacteria)]RUP40965.1 MAG: N-acetyltransferase [Gordonia sp. (in: high G+C Gram-positive bacteria)]HNP55769.1 GNAT family N-acetyltransferase [Gordonia sp. (in: high G+C Gram-positive bacteria)]HRC49505.1 GNAT family N-acetyltransferase [Gordonia sp. (in: high G+C Gram-positive bacteria)]